MHARESKHLLDSHQIEDAWTHALRALPSVNEFAIGRWNYDSVEDVAQINQGFSAHQHTAHHSSNDCRLLQVPVGEVVFSAAISSLKRAASRIEELDISHITSADLR